MGVLTSSELSDLILDRLQANVSTDPAFTSTEILRHINEAYSDVWEISGGALKRVAGGTLWTAQPTADTTGIVTTVLSDIGELREVFSSTSSSSTGDATAGDVPLEPVDVSQIHYMRRVQTHFGGYLTPKVYALTRNFSTGATTGGTVSAMIQPDADVTQNWTRSTGSTTYKLLNEAVATDADYIETAADADVTEEVGLQDFGVTPGSNSVVAIRFRAKAVATVTLTVSLVETSTVRASYAPTLTTSMADYSFVLTAAQIATISDWDDLRLRFVTSASNTTGTARVSWAAVSYTPESNLMRLDVWPAASGVYFPTHYVPQFVPLDASVTIPSVGDIESRDIGLLAAARMAPLTGRAEFAPGILADVSQRTTAALARKMSALLNARQDK